MESAMNVQRRYQRMAQDPDIDFELLESLSWCAAEEIMENPALSLFLLEEPLRASQLIRKCKVILLEYRRSLEGYLHPEAGDMARSVELWGFEYDLEASMQVDTQGPDEPIWDDEEVVWVLDMPYRAYKELCPAIKKARGECEL